MNKNKDKTILSLCSGTGAWEKPYIEAGYNVISITLPYYDILRTKVEKNKITFWSPKKKPIYPYMEIPINKIYGILAAPPCTMFSIARRNAKTPPNFKAGMEVVNACLKIICDCRIKNKLKFWALENPRGILRQFIGKPPFSFKHWEFEKNSQHEKTTDIWGYFNFPIKKIKEKPQINHANLDKSWQKPIAPDEYKYLNLNRTEIRAITPAGFAQAFFDKNK